MGYICGNYQTFLRKLHKDHNVDLSNALASKIVTAVSRLLYAM